MTLDAAALFALGTALCYALADMCIRLGLKHTNAFVGTTISQSTQVAYFLLLFSLTGFDLPPPGTHYLWIMAGGMGQPALFAIFFMIRISRIGVSRAAPIKGISPMFGALFAILFFGERPALHHIGGIVFVVAGVALVSSGKTEGRWRRADAVWPVLAALSAGLGANFWRRGLPGFPNPLAATLVALSASLLVVGTYTFFAVRRNGAGDLRRAILPFMLTGLVGGTGTLLYANALQRAEVYRVLPLIQTAPIFTVAFALLFVRRAERITWRVPAGAILTVGGALLVTMRFGGS